MVYFFKKYFVAIVGLSSLLFLLLLSIIFYQERIYFSDPAYQLFLLVNDETIEVMTNRWPSTIFRFLPFLGMKLSLSVSSLSKLFSISFPLYHLACFSICLFYLKDRLMSMLILFALLIGTTETFYWCSSDLLQGILSFILAISFYRNSSGVIPKYLISAFLIIAAVFFHPLVLFPFFYMVKDDVLERRRLRSMDLHLPILFGATWIIRNRFFTTWYDNAKSKEFWDSFHSSNLLELEAHKIFITEIPVFYQLVFFILIIDVFIFFKRKEWLRLLFLISSCLVMLLVIHIGNPNGVRHFYRESSYICLALFVSYPFLKHIFLDQFIKIKYRITIPILLLFSFFRIINFSTDYSLRVDWLKDNLAQAKCEKSILAKNESFNDLLKMDWGVPFESALLAAEENESKTIFYSNNTKDYLKKENDQAFLSPFKLLFTNDFNEQYFKFEKGYYCLNPQSN